MGEGGGVDAAELGLALAFPGALRAHIAGVIGQWAPVEAAMAAGWAGIERLRVATAGLNGAVAVPRRAQGRAGGVVGEDAAGSEGSAEVAAAVEVAADGAGPEVRRALAEVVGAAPEGWAMDAGVAPAAGIASGVPEGGASGGGGARGGLQAEEPSRRGASGGSGLGVALTVGTGGRALDEAVAPAVLAGVAASERVGSGGGVAERPEGGAVSVVPVMRDDGPALAAAGGEAGWAEVAAASVAPDRATGLVGPETRVSAGDGGGASAGGAMATASAPGGVRLRADVAAALQERVASGMRDDAPGGVGLSGLGFGAAAAEGGRRGASGGGRGRATEDGSGAGPDAAAAPAGQEQGVGGPTGGSVYLDGHLMGEWLSERMGRDAARPGSGTTFFDARQAPAWTPAGVL